MRILLICISAMVIVSACSKEDEPSYQYSIEGTWKNPGVDWTLNDTGQMKTIWINRVWTFTANGTTLINGTPVSKFTRTNENTLLEEFTDSTGKRKRTWTIEVLNDSIFKMSNSDDEPMRFNGAMHMSTFRRVNFTKK